MKGPVLCLISQICAVLRASAFVPRTLQTQPTVLNMAQSNGLSSILESTPQEFLPKLIVFDLDNTLWTPELYQIRQRHVPQANKEIRLFGDASSILETFKAANIKLAIASRTHKRDWARTLLQDFNVRGLPLERYFEFTEIQQGSKRVHFENLKKATGLKLEEMVFFDDDARMNLGEVSSMGVLCSHCPMGIQLDLVCSTVQKYASLQRDDLYMGQVLNARNLGLAAAQETQAETRGRVKFYSKAKRFGFVVDQVGTEYFFHQSKIPQGMKIKPGMNVVFERSMDGQGRSSAVILSEINGKTRNGANGKSKRQDVMSMPCFSMSQPFAALLLNGIKTVETRNNDMFANLPAGTKVLLHCGQRDWKDQEAPRRLLKEAGYTENEIDNLSTLPKGFAKGSIVGILTVGETYESTHFQRQDSTLQRQVVARAQDMGRICTPISKAAWLKRPMRARGSAGVYQVDIPMNVLPNDLAAQTDRDKTSQVWSISG